MTDEIQTLVDELADLAREVILAAGDKRLSLDEVVSIGGDLVDVVEALRAVAQGSPEKRAMRRARRMARKAARQARKSG